MKVQKMQFGAIIGIAIGGIVVLAAILGMVYYFGVKGKDNDPAKDGNQKDAAEFMNVQLEDGAKAVPVIHSSEETTTTQTVVASGVANTGYLRNNATNAHSLM